MLQSEYNLLSGQILDSCMEVHKQMGPGLLESVYEYALMTEFSLRQIEAKAHIAIPLFYKGINTGKAFEIDILVKNEIILELKSVEVLHPIYTAQLLTYLKLSNKKLGFLINFNETLMKHGFKRFVNNF